MYLQFLITFFHYIFQRAKSNMESLHILPIYMQKLNLHADIQTNKRFLFQSLKWCCYYYSFARMWLTLTSLKNSESSERVKDAALIKNFWFGWWLDSRPQDSKSTIVLRFSWQAVEKACNVKKEDDSKRGYLRRGQGDHHGIQNARKHCIYMRSKEETILRL